MSIGVERVGGGKVLPHWGMMQGQKKAHLRKVRERRGGEAKPCLDLEWWAQGYW